MPLMTPDFTTVDANIPIYDAGRYQVKVTKRTPFARTSRPDKNGDVHTSAGVRYSLEMVGAFDREGNLSTEIAGKACSPMTCYVHSEGGWSFSKGFLMAAAGFDGKQEQEANADFFQKQDWTFDGEAEMAPEQFQVGSGWDVPVDVILDVTLTKKPRKDEQGNSTDEFNQEFSSWAPVRAQSKKKK